MRPWDCTARSTRCLTCASSVTSICTAAPSPSESSPASLCESVETPRAQHELGAVPRQTACGGFTQPAAGAGDDDHFVLDAVCHGLSSPTLRHDPGAASRSQRPTSFCRCSGYRPPCTVMPATAPSISLRSSGVSVTAAAATFSARRCSLVVPGIGTIHGCCDGLCASTQASATWARVACLPRGDVAEQINQGLVRVAGFRREPRHDIAEVVLVERGGVVDRPGEEALAQRAERHETDPELFERRQDLGFRFTPPQRILALQRRDRLHRVRPPDGRCAGLGEAEMPDLALLDQLLHRAGDILDRHVGIDAVLVEQIDDVGLQSLERGLGHLADALRPAVQAALLARRGIDIEAEFGRDHDLFADSAQAPRRPALHW